MVKTSSSPYYERLASDYDRRWNRYNAQVCRVAVDMLQLSGAERLLDVGCGTGELIARLLDRFPALHVVGLDAVPDMLAQARKKLLGRPGVVLREGSATALPFDSATFDVVVSASVLHHVSGADRALAEWTRVLRADGQLVLVDWCRDFWQNRVWHPWLRLVDRSYVRMYRVQEATTLLSRAGATVEHVRRFVAPPLYGMMALRAGKRSGAG